MSDVYLCCLGLEQGRLLRRQGIDPQGMTAGDALDARQIFQCGAMHDLDLAIGERPLQLPGLRSRP